MAAELTASGSTEEEPEFLTFTACCKTYLPRRLLLGLFEIGWLGGRGVAVYYGQCNSRMIVFKFMLAPRSQIKL